MEQQTQIRKDLFLAQSIVTQNEYNLSLLIRVSNFLGCK